MAGLPPSLGLDREQRERERETLPAMPCFVVGAVTCKDASGAGKQ